MNDLFADFDEIADVVCQDASPNTPYGIELSNAELCDEICDAWDVDCFDLFADQQPKEALGSEEIEYVRAYAYYYLLRYQTFENAKDYGVGTPQICEALVAHSEAWFLRFQERVLELDGVEDRPRPFN